MDLCYRYVFGESTPKLIICEDDSCRSQLMALAAAAALADDPRHSIPAGMDLDYVRASLASCGTSLCRPDDPVCWKMMILRLAHTCAASEEVITRLEEGLAPQKMVCGEATSELRRASGMHCVVHFEDVDGVRKSISVVAPAAAGVLRRRLGLTNNEF